MEDCIPKQAQIQACQADYGHSVSYRRKSASSVLQITFRKFDARAGGILSYSFEKTRLSVLRIHVLRSRISSIVRCAIRFWPNADIFSLISFPLAYFEIIVMIVNQKVECAKRRIQNLILQCRFRPDSYSLPFRYRQGKQPCYCATGLPEREEYMGKNEIRIREEALRPRRPRSSSGGWRSRCRS